MFVFPAKFESRNPVLYSSAARWQPSPLAPFRSTWTVSPQRILELILCSVTGGRGGIMQFLNASRVRIVFHSLAAWPRPLSAAIINLETEPSLMSPGCGRTEDDITAHTHARDLMGLFLTTFTDHFMQTDFGGDLTNIWEESVKYQSIHKCYSAPVWKIQEATCK